MTRAIANGWPASAWMREAKCGWWVYSTATLAAFGLKAHYSRAGVDDLAWILAPTAAAVGWLRGEPLVHDSDLGWVARDRSFFIAPACAGVNFLILVFAAGACGLAHRAGSTARRAAWLLASACSAYGFTVAINALRIAAAVALYRAELHGGWLTQERVHRLAGTGIYLGGLWLAWGVLGRLASAIGGSASAPPPHRAAPRVALLPLAAYLGMTIAVPLLNGALSAHGARSLEHVLTVSIVALGSVVLLSTIHCATSGLASGGKKRDPGTFGSEVGEWTGR